MRCWSNILLAGMLQTELSRCNARRSRSASSANHGGRPGSRHRFIVHVRPVDLGGALARLRCSLMFIRWCDKWQGCSSGRMLFAADPNAARYAAAQKSRPLQTCEADYLMGFGS